jgi:crotonobetaine/carnitine-CoA ligase
LRSLAHAQSDRLFLDFNGTPFTYGDAFTEVTSLANGFSSFGAGPGSVVGGMLDNNSDAIFGWMAANTAGAVWLGVNTALKGDFLSHVLRESGVRMLIVEPEYFGRVTAVAEDVPGLSTLFVRGALDAIGTQSAELGERRIEVRSADELRLGGGESDLLLRPSASDISCLIVTGGTTGPSKCCALQHSYLCNFARQVNETAGRLPDEVSLNPMPAYHMNLLTNTVISSLLVGGSGVVLPRFSVSGFWPAVERTEARIVNLLGSMISMVGSAPDTEVSKRCYGQIKAVIGAPFPAELQEMWRNRFGIEVAGLNGYGLTEAVAITSLKYGETAKPGSSGRRNADFDVIIVDDNDRELPAGQVGEIACRPKRPGIMFAGYLGRPQETLDAMRNLWFHTGDLGRFDEDGFLYFVDRKKDYLRRRGENISSVEVERTFLGHPDVVEVAVYAVPSEMTEDDLMVSVVLQEGTELTHEALFQWSTDRLPYFALPRYIDFRVTLPKSPLGRVLKYELKAEGVTSETWDRDVAGVEYERR